MTARRSQSWRTNSGDAITHPSQERISDKAKEKEKSKKAKEKEKSKKEKEKVQ